MLRYILLGSLFFIACEAEPTAAPFVPPEKTFAGRTENTDLFAAVVSGPAGVEAYLCDGEHDFWFRGTPSAPMFELTDEQGRTLLLAFEGEHVAGVLVESDTAATRFELPVAEGEVLFRAETGLGSERVLGGWIRLPDGDQRGAIRIGGATLESSLNSALEVACAVCAALSIAPAPYTPSLVQRRPNQPQVFTVIALGDSMMAGEGAPVLLGQHTADGLSGDRELWNTGQPIGGPARVFTLPAPLDSTALLAEARRCHRGAAGAGIAARALQDLWSPGVEIVHQSFACSGAQTTTMLDARLSSSDFYSGPGGCGELPEAQRDACFAKTDDLETPVPSQLTAMSSFLRANSLSADAVVMSIGVNDLGFSKIIADCVGPFSECDLPTSASRMIFARGEAALPGRYKTLARALVDAGVPAGNVYVSQYPDPMRRTSSDQCNGSEFADSLLAEIDEDEAVFARGLARQINELVENGARDAGWRLVNSHVGTEAGHGICSSSPWFNDNKTALRTQGADLVSPGLGIDISSGMVHPNQAGQRDMYAPAWQSVLDVTLRARFTPKTPTGLRATRFERLANEDVRVTLQWNDTNVFESSTQLVGLSPSPLVLGPDVTTTTVVVSKSAPRGSVSVRACLDAATDLCSNDSAAIEFEAIKPSGMPTDVGAIVSINPLKPGIQLNWRDSGPRKLFTTVEIDRNGVITREAIETQQRLLPETDSVDRFRVATCNSFGCGPVSPWVEFRRPLELPRECVPPQQSRINGCR